MCNYPEESSRPLSAMECQNLFEQMVEDDIARQNQYFVEKLKSKYSDNMSVGELMDNEDGENIPTLTKDTIEQATDAFMEAANVDLSLMAEDINETSNTDYGKEDTPDECTDECTDESNPYKKAIDECIRNYEENQKRKKDSCDCDGNCLKCEDKCARVKSQMENRLGGLGGDKWKVDMALSYIESRQVNRSNIVPYIIAEVYNELTDNQRRLIVEKAPWLAEEFKKLKERQDQMQDERRIEAADEKSKQQAEAATAKMEEMNTKNVQDMFAELQKTGVISQMNTGESNVPGLGTTCQKLWGTDPKADLGNTLIMGMMPSLTDTVQDGNGTGKGDCTVADVWERDVARVQKVNQSFKVTPDKKPLTPEESLIALMTDMPKSMVDKILTIPTDDWQYSFDGTNFELNYNVASRSIRLAIHKCNLSDTEHLGDVFSVRYINEAPGSVKYMRGFHTLKDITSAGPNAKRLYEWFGKTLAKFFN